VYGQRDRWNASVDVSRLEWGVQGFEIHWVPGSGLFQSAAHADVNGDSTSDSYSNIIIGAQAGAAYVLFGGRFPSAVSALALGRQHTCALLNNPVVRCWGTNMQGELGTCMSASLQERKEQMGHRLSDIVLGTLQNVIQISAAGEVTCALVQNSSKVTDVAALHAKCWGDNQYRQLRQEIASTMCGSAVGSLGDSLPYIILGTGRGVASIHAGAKHTCAVLNDASLKCFGSNEFGQLWLEDSAQRWASLSKMGDSLLVVNLGGSAPVLSASLGLFHTCALLADGRVKCFGYNEFGQLAVGDALRRGDKGCDMGALPFANLGSNVSVVHAKRDTPGEHVQRRQCTTRTLIKQYCQSIS
jgi:alpha-tubulin suppressor-like RCC1 family protein